MLDGPIVVQDKGVREAMAMHDMRDPATIHDNLQAKACSCRNPGRVSDMANFATGEPRNGVEPVAVSGLTESQAAAALKFNNSTGDACLTCGSTDMYRTGSCMTCHSCGATGGCA